MSQQQLKLKLKFCRERGREQKKGTINQANCGTDREREREEAGQDKGQIVAQKCVVIAEIKWQ